MNFNLKVLKNIIVNCDYIFLGYLSSKGRFKYLPKVFAASLCGFIIGNFSYRSECENSVLLKIPNSNLASFIRRRRGGEPVQFFTPVSDTPLNIPTERIPQDTEMASGPDYSQFSNTDEYYRPDYDCKRFFKGLFKVTTKT